MHSRIPMIKCMTLLPMSKHKKWLFPNTKHDVVCYSMVAKKKSSRIDIENWGFFFASLRQSNTYKIGVPKCCIDLKAIHLPKTPALWATDLHTPTEPCDYYLVKYKVQKSQSNTYCRIYVRRWIDCKSL